MAGNAVDTGKEYGPTRQDMEEGRRREKIEKIADEMRHKKETEDSIAKYEAKQKNDEDQERQVKEIRKERINKIKSLVGMGDGGGNKKKEPLARRIGKGVLKVIDDVGPNPFSRTVTRGKKGFRPQSINSGFSSGGFPSMGAGSFGDSGLSPASFPSFGVGSFGSGNKKKSGGGFGSGLGLGSMSSGLGSGFGRPASAPKKTHRRRRPTKRRHKR